MRYPDGGGLTTQNANDARPEPPTSKSHTPTASPACRPGDGTTPCGAEDERALRSQGPASRCRPAEEELGLLEQLLEVGPAAHGRIAQRDWLGVERLPAHAPYLNPVERVWSVMRNGLSNLVLGDIDQLAALIRARPRPMQYRPELLQGCLAGIGLSLKP